MAGDLGMRGLRRRFLDCLIVFAGMLPLNSCATAKMWAWATHPASGPILETRGYGVRDLYVTASQSHRDGTSMFLGNPEVVSGLSRVRGGPTGSAFLELEIEDHGRLFEYLVGRDGTRIRMDADLFENVEHVDVKVALSGTLDPALRRSLPAFTRPARTPELAAAYRRVLNAEELNRWLTGDGSFAGLRVAGLLYDRNPIASDHACAKWLSDTDRGPKVDELERTEIVLETTHGDGGSSWVAVRADWLWIVAWAEVENTGFTQSFALRTTGTGTIRRQLPDDLSHLRLVESKDARLLAKRITGETRVGRVVIATVGTPLTVAVDVTIGAVAVGLVLGFLWLASLGDC